MEVFLRVSFRWDLLLTDFQCTTRFGTLVYVAGTEVLELESLLLLICNLQELCGLAIL